MNRGTLSTFRYKFSNLHFNCTEIRTYGLCFLYKRQVLLPREIFFYIKILYMIIIKVYTLCFILMDFFFNLNLIGIKCVCKNSKVKYA